MWTRKELKEKGKLSFKRNYWKAVLVSLLLVFMVRGAVNFGFGGRGGSNESEVNAVTTQAEQSEAVGKEQDIIEIPEIILNPSDIIGSDDPDSIPVGFTDFLIELRNTIGGIGIFALVVGGILLFIVLFIVIAAIHAFLFNPLEAGTARFFVRNLNDKAEIRELAYCYDHGYLNVVKTVFLRDLYIVLWGLLLIIPGIIKSYEYRMVNYILAENPEMNTKEVFAMSRDMMRGNKWRAFVLDLSFLGWHLLSLITIGLAGIFYVFPYRNMTNAALYEYLRYGRNEGDVVVWTES
ncbi:MAG: DUF975 family protein [Lachnospiraceae bacterium]|nr:DUF975 family protein [Blautia sp.]MBR3171663.1 DUF975 family protein [Lachnospiraceae bacterium]MBR3277769.1 DUF975 family protein [Lachnospiraceae bacterium]